MNDSQAGAVRHRTLAPVHRARRGRGRHHRPCSSRDGPPRRRTSTTSWSRDARPRPRPLPGDGRERRGGRCGRTGPRPALPHRRRGRTDHAPATSASPSSTRRWTTRRRVPAGCCSCPWLAGSMSPSTAPEMRGGYLGLTLSTERADVVRATVEGVARNLRWLLPAVDALAGSPTTELTCRRWRCTLARRSHACSPRCPDGTSPCSSDPSWRWPVQSGRSRSPATPASDPLTVTLPLAARVEPDPGAVEIHDRLQAVFEDAFSRDPFDLSGSRVMSDYPYADRFPVNRTLPEQGRATQEILAELPGLATRRTRPGRPARCSGTDVLRRPRPLRLHERGVRPVRPRQRAAARHLPERHPVRGRDHRHDPRPVPRRRGHRRRPRRPRHQRRDRQHRCTPCSPTASTPAAAGASPRRTSSSPRPAHPAFDKACHLFGIELRTAPVDPASTHGRRRRRSAATSTTNTIAIIGSACNYGYGTIDPIAELSATWRSERGIGLHVDGCLGGFILPFGQELGYDIPVFDFRLPGRHEHLGRHPQVRLRLQGHVGACCSATRRCATRSTSS